MANLGFPELVLIAVVILVLFGWKKLPDAARSVGRSMRIFKSEVKEMRREDMEDSAAASTQPVRPSELPSPSSPETRSAAAGGSAQDSFWDRPENQPRA